MGRNEDKPAEGTHRIRVDAGWATLVSLPSLRITVVEGADTGSKRDFTLETIRIGSAPENDMVLRDSTVSRRHARLEREKAGWLITDEGSSNGTFVDGVRVKEGYLKEGSRVRLGGCVLQLRSRTEHLYAVIGEEDQLGRLSGKSEKMREVYALIRAIAPTTASALIQGESGTGKELVARAIHELSGRSGPLVVFDAAATSPDLIRSELFGHAKGAFTGAAEAREGAFRRANGGTLFIDEFGELPMALQPNLLRVLESREVTPVGSDKTYPVDVRIIAATNRDLQERVAAGNFREDLYHRVAVVPIQLPSLRERREDIGLLARRFARDLAVDCELGDDVIELMARLDWPGNVRALRNAVERLGIVCRGRRVLPKDLEPDARRQFGAVSGTVVAAGGPSSSGDASEPASPAGMAKGPPAKTLEETERDAILAALEATGGNKMAAARLLGIAVTTLTRKLAAIPGRTKDES